jgi:hypothetical protein
MAKWKYIEIRCGYKVWRRISGGKPIYQVTKGPTPSKGSGGYYNKEALLKLKGCKAGKE